MVRINKSVTYNGKQIHVWDEVELLGKTLNEMNYWERCKFIDAAKFNFGVSPAYLKAVLKIAKAGLNAKIAHIAKPKHINAAKLSDLHQLSSTIK